MPRTARYTLSTTPTQVDASTAYGDRASRHVTVIAQAAGTVVVLDDGTGDPTTEGARVTLAAGGSIEFDQLAGAEDVWMATASGTLAVDVIEMGVA